MGGGEYLLYLTLTALVVALAGGCSYALRLPFKRQASVKSSATGNRLPI
jgi:hypothetical protein